ncbi:hypothetical protein [Poseidonocella sp. HB161398]|uniref:hypothetical protein n=1 Tax=Poseidonocella sp. HB161398 TaxID=2320855 RepID=UPI0011098061|nr:hypothetical protein [Poseidonocella sp. HB161398]
MDTAARRAHGFGTMILAALAAGLATCLTMLWLSEAGNPLRRALGVPELQLLPVCATETAAPPPAAIPPPDAERAGYAFTRPKPLDLGPRGAFIRLD